MSTSPSPTERRKSSSSSLRKLSIFNRKGSGATEPVAIDHSEGLVFKDVCVDITDKRILWSVSGNARPGHVLAILGPSGSGKTTLLNTLAGQLKPTSGSMTMNGRRMTKRTRRNLSYVLQADIFFPNLTLRETIRYSALLRLPREFTFKEKLAKVEEIITTLRLNDCANTIIGNELERGLSGGEKKRTNIGCELLTDPRVLLLDEPTSGLDSSSALNLMETLVDVARTGNKTIVTSIHQPSSQLFHMFDRLMLMAKGKVAYFGKASDAMDYVASLGLRCTMHYNPADYLLELVSEDKSRKVLIGEDPKQEERPVQKKWWQKLFSRSPKPLPAPTADVEAPADIDDNKVPIEDYSSSPVQPRLIPMNAVNILTSVNEDVESNEIATAVESIKSPPEDSGVSSSDTSSVSTGPDDDVKFSYLDRKWATRWYWQFFVLTVRTFRQSRHNITSWLNIMQAILLSITCCFVWFQVPKLERNINDGFGYLFFAIIFWTFNATFGAAFTFPTDHVVINKERNSGMYHLSAYFMAKLVSELPLVLLTPSLFHILTYLIVGLNYGADGFFGNWFTLILTSIVGQSLGLFLGASIMNVRKIITFGSVLILTMMLLGGFYVEALPFWFQWARYLSFITYGYRAAIQFSYPPHIQYSCGELSIYSVCNNSTMFMMPNATNATISGVDIVEQLGIDTPLYANLLILLLYALVIRYIAYLALRYLHRHK